MLPVRSVEALSEMISSKSGKLWPSSASSDSATYFSPLYTGRPMVSRGTVLIDPPGSDGGFGGGPRTVPDQGIAYDVRVIPLRRTLLLRARKTGGRSTLTGYAYPARCIIAFSGLSSRW